MGGKGGPSTTLFIKFSFFLYKNYIDILIYPPKFWQKEVPSPAVVHLRGWRPGSVFEPRQRTLWVLFFFSQPQYFSLKSDLNYPKPSLLPMRHNLNPSQPQVHHGSSPHRPRSSSGPAAVQALHPHHSSARCSSPPQPNSSGAFNVTRDNHSSIGAVRVFQDLLLTPPAGSGPTAPPSSRSNSKLLPCPAVVLFTCAKA